MARSKRKISWSSAANEHATTRSAPSPGVDFANIHAPNEQASVADIDIVYRTYDTALANLLSGPVSNLLSTNRA